jgi:hypothetical protein
VTQVLTYRDAQGGELVADSVVPYFDSAGDPTGP